MSTQLSGLVIRRTLRQLVTRMADEPVVLLQGPRSVGKSTLLRQFAAEHATVTYDLDDPAMRDLVAADPGRFVTGPGPVCIDEYQKAPLVLDSIKAELNRDSAPGRFVLAGSTRNDALPVAAQSLTGRVDLLTVYPLTQGEVGGFHEHLVSDLFTDPPAAVPTGLSVTTREQYIARIVAGGFPFALSRTTTAARNRWFDTYLALTLDRDVRELSRIRQGALLPLFVQRLAGQTGQLVNVSKAASSVGLDKATANEYLRLLEAVFLFTRLPSWGRTLNSRAVSAPKLHVMDSGVAARLLRLSEAKLARRDPAALTEFGHLLETFVVGELVRQASFLDDACTAGHWRTRDDDEVDLVLERDDGAIVAFEVKSAGRVPAADLAGLRKLRNLVGPAFVAGVALHLGQAAYTVEDRLHVLPVDRLWS